MNNLSKYFFIFFALTLFVKQEIAFSKIIHSIAIQGSQRVEKSFILSKIKSRRGTSLKDSLVSQDIKNIFATGLFENVVVSTRKKGNKVQLVYKVTERPPVAEVKFIGHDRIDEDELREATDFKDDGRALTLDQIQEGISKIKKLYEEKGFYFAKVQLSFKKDKKNKSRIAVIKIIENNKVLIRSIKILGAKTISESKLKSAMQTEEAGLFSFITGSGAYKQEILDRDIQILNLLYFNKGFVQVRIGKPDVKVSSDKNSIHIKINIQEGQQFNVGRITFGGDTLFSRKEFMDKIRLNTGDLFSYSVLQGDLKILQAMYGDLGYAFANPILRTKISETEKVVDVTFQIEKGRKAYIGEINVKGNRKTRDKVFRRELRFKEGDLYNETKKNESLANIKRLGFFEDINFITSTPKNRYNIINIDIDIKERSTGTIQLGAGYSGFQGFVLNGQVSQINFLGRGQRLSAAVNWSREEQIFDVSFTDPYIFDTDLEAGFDVYRRRRNLIDYNEKKSGGGFRLGYPLAPFLKGIFGYKVDDTNLKLLESGDEDLFRVETANGISSAATLSLVYDKRNDRFFPTAGLFGRISLEYAGLGGDIDYRKLGVTFRFYKNIFWKFIWRNNINYGFIESNTSGKEPPFNQLYLLGGANSLRGYKWFSIGRKIRSSKVFESCAGTGRPLNECENLALRPFGGRQQFYYQTEIQFPIIKPAGIQGVVFFDIGEAQDTLEIKDFRSNVGFGFRWFSPIGPLRFEWGFPINRNEELGEASSEFQFSIGAPF